MASSVGLLASGWKTLSPLAISCLPTYPPRLAKDRNYASAILEEWKREENEQTAPIEWKAVSYSSSENENEVPLYGYLIRREPSGDESEKPSPDGEAETATGPSHQTGILLFHTGAGPHDVFLLWKATSLLRHLPDDVSITVMIADLLSDESGWGWDPDRTRFQNAYRQLLSTDKDNNRNILQSRIQASKSALLREFPGIDQWAALGWCLGGHPILEMSRVGKQAQPNLRALVTFHGVFDTGAVDDGGKERVEESPCEVLVCHGIHDPFVPSLAIKHAITTLQNHRHVVSLLKLDAKHGFTNPAQKFNENPAFAYDPNAADEAWRQSIALLRRVLE